MTDSESRSAPSELHPEDWRVPAGWNLVYRATTGSTNDDAKAAARAGGHGRTVFLANGQSTGRGRYGRPWVAPAGTCLLFSLILEEAISPIDCTAAASVAIADVIAADLGLAARIKWPNDVMIAGRKVCGILTEVVAFGDQVATVIGIGLNVNLDLGTEGLPATATSLSSELGRPVAREPLFTSVLTQLNRLLADRSLLSGLHDRWESLLWRRSQVVHLSDGSVVLRGVVEGLAPAGGLLLRGADGTIREITTGELVLE